VLGEPLTAVRIKSAGRKARRLLSDRPRRRDRNRCITQPVSRARRPPRAAGAAYGNPLERNPDRVRLNVLEKSVSIEKARDVHGVIFTDSTNEEISRCRSRSDRAPVTEIRSIKSAGLGRSVPIRARYLWLSSVFAIYRDGSCHVGREPVLKTIVKRLELRSKLN
jgi:hypothetical protein